MIEPVRCYSVGEFPKEEAEELFIDIKKTGVHGQKWPRETVCVFECMLTDIGRKLYVIRSQAQERPVHAEYFLIKELEKIKGKLDEQLLTVYMNYSPCSFCSVNIRHFMTNHVELNLSFIFAQLYNISRPSCKPEVGRCGMPGCNRDTEDRRSNRLNLVTIKDCVRPANLHDWRYLKGLLSYYDDSDRDLTRDRRNEDKCLLEDWNQIQS